MPNEGQRGRRTRAGRGALWVGGLGAAFSLLLGVFAFGPWGDAGAARDAARETVRRESESFLAREWTALREGGALVAPAGPTYRWESGASGPPPRPLPRPVTPAGPGGSRSFPARLAAAEVLEVYDADPRAALEQVEAALEDPELAPGQRALGRLRAIQLAGRAEAADVVLGQWQALETELSGAETSGGLSILLTAGLSAARAVDDTQRCAIAERLSRAWAAGALALPEEEPVNDPSAELGLRLSEPALITALAERLAGLGPAEDCLDPGLERRRGRWLAHGLATRLGTLPEPLRPNAWELHATGAGPLAVRGASDGVREAVFVDPRGLGEALVARLTEAGAGEAWRVETARGTLPRSDSFLGGWLRVASAPSGDPEPVVRAGRLATLLRFGLLLAAASLGVASLTTARALARERRLAELKNTFVANVSHELRTPIASILLMAENLEEGHVTEASSLARYYANLRGEAQRLRRLVADVLDFSRLERGAGPRLEREEQELGAWFEGLSRDARQRVAPSGYELRIESSELDGRRARLDGEALRRVVLNLIDNAVKYGAAPLGLEARCDGDALVLTVTDAGKGIPASERARVFEPFERVEAQGGAAGTGLGLAIVRALVEAHGGRVSVGSGEDGRGARFEARVPLESDEHPKDGDASVNGGEQ